MPDWKPPPVPTSRLDRGDEWRELWDEAHRVMRPYGRAPGVHLIDVLLRKADRRWLRNHLDALAIATLGSGDYMQYDGRRRWHTRLHDPATMKRRIVRVVLERDDLEVFTAFPLSRGAFDHANRR